MNCVCMFWNVYSIIVNRRTKNSTQWTFKVVKTSLDSLYTQGVMQCRYLYLFSDQNVLGSFKQHFEKCNMRKRKNAFDFFGHGANPQIQFVDVVSYGIWDTHQWLKFLSW